jgi:hypothetical protein
MKAANSSFDSPESKREFHRNAAISNIDCEFDFVNVLVRRSMEPNACKKRKYVGASAHQ